MEDALSNVFGMLRLKGCIYFQRDFFAPWGMTMTQGRFAQFHLIVSGECAVEVDGQYIAAEQGDVLLFPRGYPHRICDSEGSHCPPGEEVLASFNSADPAFSEGGHPTRLVCGHYEYRDVPPVLLIDQLPDFIHVKALNSLKVGATKSILPLLLHELDSPEPGSSVIAQHLAEVLLIQTLRAYVLTGPRNVGLLSGLNDPQLGQALKLAHAHPEWNLSVERLAREAGMSRSIFSEKFRAVVGTSPYEYLTKMRMLRASDLLLDRNIAITQIAEQVGYSSNIAFARAFKREVGATPSEFRRLRPPLSKGAIKCT